MMLSLVDEPLLLITIFRSNEPSKNMAAKIVVDFVRKSDVLRTPKEVAIPEPPKLPESPLPLDDWSRTTAINSIATITKIIIENMTIFAFFK